MVEIVNLRQARKARAQADKQKQAAENRARYGASKDMRALEETRRANSERFLAGHRRENGGDAKT